MKPETTKFKPEVKNKWIEALRSGKYKQGNSTLLTYCYFQNNRTTKQYCCLGVLSSVCNKTSKKRIRDISYEKLSVQNIYCTNHVDESMLDFRPFILRGELSKEDKDKLKIKNLPVKVYLDYLNDQMVPFEIIADLIEKYM